MKDKVLSHRPSVFMTLHIFPFSAVGCMYSSPRTGCYLLKSSWLSDILMDMNILFENHGVVVLVEEKEERKLNRKKRRPHPSPPFLSVLHVLHRHIQVSPSAASLSLSVCTGDFMGNPSPYIREVQQGIHRSLFSNTMFCSPLLEEGSALRNIRRDSVQNMYKGRRTAHVSSLCLAGLPSKSFFLLL